MRLLLAALLGLSPAASATPSSNFDGLVTETIRVSAPGTLRFTFAGGGTVDGSPALGGITAEYALAERLAVRAAMRWEYGALSPVAALRWQLLEQSTALVDASASVQLRAVGMEGAGPQVDARLGLSRVWDRVSTSIAVQLGRSTLLREDVDFETGASVGFRLNTTFRLGAEARFRTELVDVYETEEDHGRPFELIAGPTASAELGATVLQLLVGYRAPRGPWEDGLIAMGQVGFAF